jgi:hypothetical protein
MRIMENRARGYAESVLAFIALEGVAGMDSGNAPMTALRAGYAFRPAYLFQMFPASFFTM